MRLNTLRPSGRRTRKRVGRGSGSGVGKTCGRGQKGQRSRSGGGTMAGFEGGQMPLQRRLPKFGFASRKARFSDEVRLDALASLDSETIDIAALKAAKLVGHRTKTVKIIATGDLEKAITVSGVRVTRGARAAIEAAGGKVED